MILFNKIFKTIFIILICTISFTTIANVAKSLPYPSGKISANEVAEQVYFVNHFYGTKNYGIGKDGNTVTTLILRNKGDKPLTIALERYLNNNYSNGVINAQDLAIFRSGKLKGTGMLITDFVEQDKSQTYAIYLPSIRKVRRFAQPAHDDAWGGSDFTFGDVTLRKPNQETHQLLTNTTIKECLSVMYLPSSQRNKYTKNSDIKEDCSVIGKNVYQLKSTTKNANWWYDYRISLVDAESFVDYKTEYYKGSNKIKVIDRSWLSANLADKRANYWGYWYGKTLATGHETLAFIPKGITKVDAKYKKTWWSERTLRKIR